MTLERNFQFAIIKYIDQLRDDLASLDPEEGISNAEYSYLLTRVDSIAIKLEQHLCNQLDELIYTYRSL